MRKPPRFPRSCSHIIEAIVIFLIVFTPLAFGSVEIWSTTVLECMAFIAAMVLVIKMFNRKTLSFTKMWLNVPLAVVLGLILLQILPLFPNTLSLLSPGTLHLYMETLPGWPEYPPFHTVNNILADNGIGDYTAGGYVGLRCLSIYKYLTLEYLFKYLAYLCVFYVIINNFGNTKAIRRITIAIISMGFILAVFGIIQHFTWNEKIYWFRELSLGGGVFGPFVNRNHFAGYMEMAILLALGQIVRKTLEMKLSPREVGIKERVFDFFNREGGIIVLLLSATIIMIASLFMSLSRGGIMSLAIGAAVFAGLVPRHKRVSLIFIILGVILVLEATSELVIRRFVEEVGPYGRYAIWEDTIDIFKSFPIFGSGLGTFRLIYQKYQTSDYDLFFRHAHNDYMELLTDMGVLGLSAAIAACALYLILLVSLLNKRRSFYVRAEVCAGIGAISAILAHSIVDFNLHIPSNALLVTIIAAITLVRASSYTSPRGEIKNLLRKRRATYRKGYLSALGYFGAVIALLMVSVYPVRNLLGELYYWRKSHSSVRTSQISLLEKAVAIQPYNSDYYKELSEIYIEEGQRNLARPYLQKAILLKPTDPYLHLGMAYLLNSYLVQREIPPNIPQWQEAINQQMEITVQLAPHDAHIYDKVGRYYLNRWKEFSSEEQRKALIWLSRAMDLDDRKWTEIVEVTWKTTRDRTSVQLTIPERLQDNQIIMDFIEELINKDK